MKAILVMLALVAGVGTANADQCDDGRHWNDLSRSQDELRGCKTESHNDNGGWRAEYGYNDDFSYGYDYGYDQRNDRRHGYRYGKWGN